MSCSNNSCCGLQQSTEGTKIIKYDVSNYGLLLDKLQRSLYEYSSLLNILTQFTSDSPFKPDMERYTVLLNEYIDIFITYNLYFQHFITIALTELNIDSINVVNSAINIEQQLVELEVKTVNE